MTVIPHVTQDKNMYQVDSEACNFMLDISTYIMVSWDTTFCFDDKKRLEAMGANKIKPLFVLDKRLVLSDEI